MTLTPPRLHPRRLAVLLLAALAAASCEAPFAVDGERMQARVAEQVAMGPRISGTEGNARAQAWIAAHLERTGGAVERQSFVDSTLGRPLPLTNLIGRYGPEGGRRILFCAHFDTRPFADQDPDPARRDDPVPGANDGGSGVAVLLELAELMHRQPPRVGVDLVFFDGEDLGRSDRPEEFCLGSRGYARRLPPPGDPRRPVAGFLFDMVGDADLSIPVEGNSLRRASNLVALVLEGARATGARSFRDEEGITIVDDHVPLLDAGLPTVDIIDFEYPAWHTVADLPDRTSAASLAEVARVGAWLLYRSPLARP